MGEGQSGRGRADSPFCPHDPATYCRQKWKRPSSVWTRWADSLLAQSSAWGPLR